MLIEFVILDNAVPSWNEILNRAAADVAFQLKMPMPPRVGETFSGLLNGEEEDGRHAEVMVTKVKYIQRKGYEPDCDAGAIVECKIITTWLRKENK
jgi:hypothetical protein